MKVTWVKERRITKVDESLKKTIKDCGIITENLSVVKTPTPILPSIRSLPKA